MRTEPVIKKPPPQGNGLNLEMEKAQQDGTEYQFGALSQPSIVSIPPNEREQYLPRGETQFDSFGDFQDCASRSPTNHLEALFTYHVRHDMADENVEWMYNNGYIVFD